MISQILKGISHVRDGFKLIKLRGVKRYVTIPALINIILFTAAIWYGYIKFDSLLEQKLPNWLDWLELSAMPKARLVDVVNNQTSPLIVTENNLHRFRPWRQNVLYKVFAAKIIICIPI